MSERSSKKLRKEARRMAEREQAKLVPEFKKFVNTQLHWWERWWLAIKIIFARF